MVCQRRSTKTFVAPSPLSVHADLYLGPCQHLDEVGRGELATVLVAHAFDHTPHIGRSDGQHFTKGYCGSGVAQLRYVSRKLGHKCSAKRRGPERVLWPVGSTGGRNTLIFRKRWSVEHEVSSSDLLFSRAAG
jgi:hypothetical protein